MNLRGMKWSYEDWIRLAEDRDHWRGLVDSVMAFWVP
jgi:hypothetical protein